MKAQKAHSRLKIRTYSYIQKCCVLSNLMIICIYFCTENMIRLVIIHCVSPCVHSHLMHLNPVIFHHEKFKPRVYSPMLNKNVVIVEGFISGSNSFSESQGLGGDSRPISYNFTL